MPIMDYAKELTNKTSRKLPELSNSLGRFTNNETSNSNLTIILVGFMLLLLFFKR